MISKLKIYLLLIVVLSLVSLAQAQQKKGVPLSFETNPDIEKLKTNIETQTTQQGLTYRSMVRAQNLARAAYLNEKYGEDFTSGQTIFTSFTRQEFVKLFTGAIFPKDDASVEKPSKGSIRNLQEEIIYGDNNEVEIVGKVDNSDEEQSNISEESNDSDDIKPTQQIISGQSTFNIDWTTTTKVLVTKVKNQGSCGSCWAFTATAQIQSFYIRLKNKTTTFDLSEQQALDCSRTVGCSGGWPDNVYNYAKTNKLVRQIYYPYTASTYSGACSAKAGVISTYGKFKIVDYAKMNTCSLITTALVSKGPVGICLDNDWYWQNYVSGIISNCYIISGGHCVLLVGAKADGTTATSGNFWRFKNSWGTGWGQSGYFRARRSTTDMTSGYCKMCQYGYQTIS